MPGAILKLDVFYYLSNLHSSFKAEGIMSFTPTMPHIAPVSRPHIGKTTALRFGMAQPQPPDIVEIAKKAIPATVALEIIWPRTSSSPDTLLSKVAKIARITARITTRLAKKLAKNSSPEPPKDKGFRASGLWLQTSQGPVVITNAHVLDPPGNDKPSPKSQENETHPTILARLNVVSTHANARCDSLQPTTLAMALAERPNTSDCMAIDHDLDIAVLKPLPSEDPKKYRHIQPLEPEPDMDGVKMGEAVLGVVNDKMRTSPTLLTGVIRGFERGNPVSKKATGKEPFVDVCTTLYTMVGNSGSPVLRLRNGKTIGIHKESDGSARTWATSMADVMRKLKEWGF
ncbi:MAG TPA: serine protease [Coleofasciculaceae cyanobacterium]